MGAATEDAIRAFVVHELLFDQQHVPDDIPLLSGLLDSFSLQLLIGYVEERFNVTVDADQVTRSNFETVRTLAAFVDRLSGNRSKATGSPRLQASTSRAAGAASEDEPA